MFLEPDCRWATFPPPQTALIQRFVVYFCTAAYNIDTYGRFRYFEISPYGSGHDIIRLDRAIWEIRRYCTLSQDQRQVKLKDGEPAPMVRLAGGYLEKVIDNAKHPARAPLLWQNAFFGKRKRRTVCIKGGFHAKNSPLFLNPQIIEEVLQYVFLPNYVADSYRKLRDEGDPRLKGQK